MPKLSALFDPTETAEFTLSYGAEKVRCTYAPAEVNPERVDEVSIMLEENPDLSQGESWAILLSPLRSWDIEDEDGNELPITADNLALLPTAFLQGVQRGMLEAVRPTLRSSRSRRGSSTRRN